VSFAAPSLLVLLAVVPVAAAAYLLYDRWRAHRAARWASPVLLENMVARPPSWRRYLPPALLLAGLTLLLVGFARPQATHLVKRQDATVVLVIDVSGSMAATDVQPSRIGAARAAALRLVDALPHGYRMSVILFSDHSAVVAPPTQDLMRVRAVIQGARPGPQGTALADAVWHGVDVAQTVRRAPNGKRPPAVIVVFSDGGITAGQISPSQAIAKAQRARVPVSAVVIGTSSGIVRQPLQGGLEEQIQVPVEPIFMQAFARQTGGRLYNGAGALDVRGIYQQLGSRVGKERKKIEITAAAAGGGIAFMLIGAALSGLWFRRFV
jgi:Ca-activated chloride channel family protein